MVKHPPRRAPQPRAWRRRTEQPEVCTPPAREQALDRPAADNQGGPPRSVPLLQRGQPAPWRPDRAPRARRSRTAGPRPRVSRWPAGRADGRAAALPLPVLRCVTSAGIWPSLKQWIRAVRGGRLCLDAVGHADAPRSRPRRTEPCAAGAHGRSGAMIRGPTRHERASTPAAGNGAGCCAASGKRTRQPRHPP